MSLGGQQVFNPSSKLEPFTTEHVTMARGKELSPAQRSHICQLKQEGNPYKQIQKMLPEIPLSTIKTTCLRAAKRGPNHTSLQRTRKLAEEQCDRIYDVVTSENPGIKMKDLLEEVDHTIAKRSMRNLLREMELQRCVVKGGVWLSRR